MNSPTTSQGIVRESYDQFEDEGFEIFDKNAGYYISYQTVKPMGIEKIDRLVERLLSKGIELRFTPNVLLGNQLFLQILRDMGNT
ncbi:DUF6886 family protein [Paenibacillus lautus]|uniref:DUF6886 family protein n=1 Tax=Paenibacillus lautus TaxID=1401 RepID=UPI003D2B4724